MKTRWNEFYVLPRNFNILGIVLFGFVFLNKKTKALKKDDLAVLLNHERIHIRQQIELLIIPFFILYTLEWIILCIKFRDRDRAYRNISFEKEAYDNADDLTYLKHRKPYFWIRSISLF